MLLQLLCHETLAGQLGSRFFRCDKALHLRPEYSVMRTQCAEKKRQYKSYVFFALFCFAFWLFLCGYHFSGNEGTIKVPLIRELKLFRSSLLCYLFLLFFFPILFLGAFSGTTAFSLAFLECFFIYISDISSLFFHKTMPNGLFQAIAFLSQGSPK